MKHGSLFSGIGGFDLAAEWAGWENVFHCEWNEFGQKVLKHYWPKAITYADITKTDFTIHRGKIDILSGGFPCQPYSAAGKRKGKEDDRHLWPEMLRAIREIQPKWVVGENVLGLVNWNGGLVFDEVQADLEAEGFNVQPYVLPAVSVNAPHRRDRIWFVAYTNRNADKGELDNRENKGEAKGSSRRSDQEIRKEDQRKCIWVEPRYNGKQWNVANSQCIGSPRKEHRQTKSRFYTEEITGRRWANFPTQSPVHNGNDGFSSQLDGITFPRWRNESIKAGGNAIVPQVAYQIFKTVNLMCERQGSF